MPGKLAPGKLSISPTLILALALVSPLQAVTRFVDGTEGDDDGGGNDCLDTGAPCLTIGHAISVASSGDAIEIGNAEYTESLIVNKSLSLVGESEGGTVIQASVGPPGSPSEADERVITVEGSGLDVSISGVTIRHGNVTGSVDEGRGGGMFNRSAQLSLSNVTFSENFAALEGGGLYNAEQTATMNGVTFSGNVCSDSGGGGGGMYDSGDASTFSHVTFVDNTCQHGGGLFLSSSDALLTDVQFIRNRAANSGGGIRNTTGSSPELTNVAFVGNSAGSFGGGILIFSGTPVLTNVVFSGNAASFRGGGMDTSTSAILTNVSFSGNSAGSDGGAVRNISSGLVISNSVFWNNMDSKGVDSTGASIHNVGSAMPDIRYTLIQGCNPAGTWNQDCGVDQGGNLADQDPLFAGMPNPDNAPTTTGDLRLRGESPAIDAGDDDLVMGVDYDLDGLPRIMGEAVDLGPYEFEPPLFADRFE